MKKQILILASIVPPLVLLAGLAAHVRGARAIPRPVRQAAHTPPVEVPMFVEPLALGRPDPPPERADVPPVREVSAVVAERRAEREFWEELEALPEALGRSTCRAAALMRTAEFLGLSGRLETAAALAVSEIARAWESRNAGIESVSEAMAPEQRAILERDFQERYEAEKRAALARVESILGSAPRHRRFQARLEEWLDLIR